MKALLAFARRLDVTALILLGSLVISGPVLAQGDPGANVNIIGLTLDPNDIPDEFYRQQNEPSCAIRPGDSACMICAYNDYRTVDVFGDAWQGVSQSCDAGNSWLSRTAPGSPADLQNPLPAAFAADPRLQAIPGMAILNFIAGYRDSNEGVLAIQHWLEVNKEDADHYEPGAMTYIAENGTSGRLVDKPDMVAVIDPLSRQTPIMLSTVMENTSLGDNGTITRAFPSGKLYVSYAVFTGSSSIKVLLKVSDDWGQTWSNQALKLSENQNEVSGISLTAIGDKVLAIWRRRGDNNDSDAIMYSVITNGGKKATKGEVLAEVCAFDQPTLGGTETPDLPMVAFRTNDFPWSANDGGNFYAFYSDRGRVDGVCNPNGRPRIVVHHSSTGSNWSTTPVTISDTFTPGDNESAHPESFQFMPSAFGANGKIQVAWYDTRREAAELAQLLISPQLPYVADHIDIDPETGGGTLAFVQRKVDVYTTSMTIDQVKNETIPDAVRASQYSIVVQEDGPNEETEASFANKKMFKQGTLPFLGDYIAMAARQFREITTGNNTGKWESNASLSGGVEDFFVAWTDNRDVRGEIAGPADVMPYSVENEIEIDSLSADPADTVMLAESTRTHESGPPRDSSMVAEGLDGSDLGTALMCEQAPQYERSRDANIYGSLIKDRVRLFAPTPSKPLSGLQRAFVVAIGNSEDAAREFNLVINNQPCSSTSQCRASFRQLPYTAPFEDINGVFVEPALYETITVPPNSTLARTVFVVAGSNPAPVFVSAYEAGNSNPVAVVQLGNDEVFLDPDICSGGECDVNNSELHNLTLGNLTLGNLDLVNQELLNLTLGNLTLGNLTLGNLTLGNLTLGNLTLGNLTLGNAALVNSSLIELGIEATNNDSDPNNDLSLDSNYRDLLEWALDPANGVDPALLDPALLAMTTGCAASGVVDPDTGEAIYECDPDELLNLTLGNLTLGNLTLGNLTLGNLTLGNLTLGNLTLGNAAEPNLTLGNLTLGNLTLGNAAIDDPVLNSAYEGSSACVPNPDGAGCTDLTYDDYTYPITNRGNVTTAIDADITVDGEVAATQLIAWTANVTPTSINCESILQMEERVRAVVNNVDSDFEVADITKPFEGDISTIAGPGETVFFTLRVFGTRTQLRNATVSGFTASSQASNCRRVNGVVTCSEALNEGIEQILADRTPPVITLLGDDPLYVNVLTTYSDPGATALDAVDGEVAYTVAVTVGGDTVSTVDTSILATYEVTYTATDSAGNVGEKSRWVTVVDGIDPVLTVPADLTVTNTTGTSAVVTFTATATDNFDPSPAVSCTPSSGTSFPIGGPHVVSCTATDSAGRTDSGSFSVTVVDGVAPTISQDDITVTVDATDPDPSGKTVSYTPTTSDNVGIKPVVCTPASGWFFNIGPINPVSCTVEDDAGNTAGVTFNVAVLDGVAPVITVPADITATVTSGTETAVSYTPTATDNTGDTPSIMCTPASGSLFSIGGPHLVSCTATDSAGLTDSDSFNVTVLDGVAPIITVPADITDLEATSTAGAAASYTPTATDNTGDPPSISCTPASGSLFSIGGPHLVSCTATDAAGNSDSGSFSVTVVDSTPPSITVNDDDGIIEFTADDPRGANVDLTGIVTASDLGQPLAVSCATTDGFPLKTSASDPDSWLLPGDYTVICTASDGSSTSIDISVSIVVEIVDNVAPILTVPADFSVAGTSTAGAVVTYAVSAEDNVDSDVSIVCAPLSGSTFAFGYTTVSCTASDDGPNGSGVPNSVTETFVVSVTDGVPPVVTAPNVELRKDYANGLDPDWTSVPDLVSLVQSDGTTLINVTALDDIDGSIPSSAINCVRDIDPTDPLLTPSDFEFSDVPYVINCSAQDSAGNVGYASYSLTVRYLYDINLIPPKGRARAGSTVPLDWQYLDENGPIDSSLIDVAVTWEHWADDKCLTDPDPLPTDGTSTPDFIPDSGNSDFRYSDSNDTWQFSWQTPDGAFGPHRVSISPPGADVEDAWECINLR